jgi:hypothetical protein
MTPSKEAMELAEYAGRAQRTANGDTITGWGKHQLAEAIDTALAKARLEGAKAMQEKIATKFDHKAKAAAEEKQRTGVYGSNGGPLGFSLLADECRALDPQQVINESMEK